MYLSLTGIVAVVVFLVIFGIKILTGFSVLIETLKGAPSQSSQDKTSSDILFPPTLDPIPEATNSAMFSLTVHGQPGTTLLVYVNEEQIQKSTVGPDGNVFFSDLKAREGANTVSAKLMDDTEKTSDLSRVLTFTVNTKAPIMEIQKPDDNSEVNGDTNTVEVTGKTDPGNRITINDRFVVVSRDGSFSYSYSLSEGNNTLTITATDPAGNKTSIEKNVTYLK